jgi:hypothetical protein
MLYGMLSPPVAAARRSAQANLRIELRQRDGVPRARRRRHEHIGRQASALRGRSGQPAESPDRAQFLSQRAFPFCSPQRESDVRNECAGASEVPAQMWQG